MNQNSRDVPLVSALFITYRRFDHLRRAIETFRQNTDYPKIEVVIADDGSGAEIQEKIRKIPADGYALSPTNRGLGANNNAGIALCHGKYVLMIQDDWVCSGPPDYLSNAVMVMEGHPDLGLISFAGGYNPPDLSQPLSGSPEPCYLTPFPGEGWEYLYSDQPHLQSMESLKFVGPYREGVVMSRTEIDYARVWNSQTKYKTAVFPAYRLKTFQFDETAGSLRRTMFRNRAIAQLATGAGWLKKVCYPVYWLARVVFYSFVRLLEVTRIVR